MIKNPISALITLALATLSLPLDAAIPWDQTDLGPFQTGCFKVNNQITAKGIAIKAGDKEHPATILFDPELLRVSAGWTGGFIQFPKGRGGLEGQISPVGEVKFSTPYAPGWSAGKIGDDPRTAHQGHLSADVARYRGLYLNGNKVILSYTVGKTAALEMPEAEVRDGALILSRTIALGAGPAATLFLGTGEEMKAAVEGAPGPKIEKLADGKTVARVPARAQATTYRFVMTTGGTQPLEPSKAALPDLAALCKGGPKRWGEALEVPGKPGDNSQPYTVDDITLPEKNPYNSWMRPGGHDFLPDGTAAVANISGDVWMVSGIDEKLEHVKWKRFATGLFQPLGCKVVDGKTHVLGRDQITRLHDLNNDGEADFYENFNNDCVVTENYHEFALDLQTDREGNFYYAKGSPWTPTNRSPHQGTMIKVSKDGSSLEVFATGLRAPNGLGMGPGDILTCSDNQGHWMPANRLNIVKRGGFYGMTTAAHRELLFKAADGKEFKANPSLEEARKQYKTEFYNNSPIPVAGYDLPLVWLPMDIDNSSGGQVWVPPGEKWGPWSGRMLQTTYGKCSLFGVMMETVDGVQQGGVVRFPLSFKSGIMRGRFSPVDGQLYLSGLNVWQSNAAKDGCFQRVRFTGKPVTMPIGFATKPNGIEIQFTGPLDAGTAADAANWSAEQWNYRWTGGYGSDNVSVHDSKKKGKDRVTVSKATVSADRKSVFLELSDRVPAMTLRIKCNVKSADGAAVNYQLDSTIHRIPGQKTATR